MSALMNGLSIFDLFLTDRKTVTVVEIGRELGIHKSTASRIAAMLVATGYLRVATHKPGFELGGKFKRLGQIAAGGADLSDIAAPLLRSLVDDLGETCHLGVLDGTESVTVAVVDGHHSMRMHSFVGKRNPAHSTAMGKAVLAFLGPDEITDLYPNQQLQQTTSHTASSRDDLIKDLDCIRERGFAIDDEELEIGLRAIAAPVIDYDGDVIASVTVSCSASRVSLAQAEEYAAKVIECANSISAALGAPPSELRGGADGVNGEVDAAVA